MWMWVRVGTYCFRVVSKRVRKGGREGVGEGGKGGREGGIERRGERGRGKTEGNRARLSERERR